MINHNVMFGLMRMRGLTVEDVAKHIGISKAAFYRKMNGKSDFYRKEIVDICSVLSMNHEQMQNVFFDENVS